MELPWVLGGSMRVSVGPPRTTIASEGHGLLPKAVAFLACVNTWSEGGFKVG